jgi:hypothetical protein
MRRRTPRSFTPLLALCAAFCLGCGDTPTNASPEPVPEDVLPLFATVHPAGAVEWATGTGHSARPGDTWNTIAFNAVKRADGTVTGQLILQNRYLDNKLKMDVDCLAIDGNVAVMSGVVSQFTYPVWVGSGGWFVAEDNGEGTNAPPDRVTGVYSTDDYLPDPNYCHEIMADFEARVPPPGASIGWVALLRGNVQVRGAGDS